MRTTTDQLVRSVRIRGLAVLRVTVANAAAANRYITNTVKVLKNTTSIAYYTQLLSVSLKFDSFTRRVTVGSCLATAIKCPRRFLVLIRRRRTFVARVHF